MKKKYRILSSNGIDEKLFVNINGHNQYVFIRGKDINNPIILNLHGGPANPDAFFTYEFAKEIIDDYVYVSWDQRGCGRTYYQNKRIDSKNKTVDFEQAIKDVDELIKYLCKRFNKDKVIIMGHSYGSLLGINYISKHPKYVERYIGIGQTVSIMDTQEQNYNEIIGFAKKDDPKIDKLTKAYQKLREHFSLKNYMVFQKFATPYLIKNTPNLKQKNQIKLILSSPDLAFSDIRWLIGMLNWKKHYTRNKKLLDYTFSANVYDAGNTFTVPMYFISGEYDKKCHVGLLRKYYETISAPDKKLVIMKNNGHSPQVHDPVSFAIEVKKLLQNKNLISKKQCENCGFEYEFEEFANLIAFCPCCNAYDHLSCDYGFGPIVPCRIYHGSNVVGEVSYNGNSQHRYRIDSDVFNLHTVLKHSYLEALYEAKDMIFKFINER